MTAADREAHCGLLTDLHGHHRSSAAESCRGQPPPAARAVGSHLPSSSPSHSEEGPVTPKDRLVMACTRITHSCYPAPLSILITLSSSPRPVPSSTSSCRRHGRGRAQPCTELALQISIFCHCYTLLLTSHFASCQSHFGSCLASNRPELLTKLCHSHECVGELLKTRVRPACGCQPTH